MATSRLDCRGRELTLGGHTQLVGILNVTPDSFSDGGRWTDPATADQHAQSMVEEGAAVIDVGGQSTRPGYAEATPEEEIARVRPVLERLVPTLPVPFSIDTYRSEVARAALAAGAHLVNDQHGFQGDPAMAGVVAEFGCPVILMHCEAGFAEAPGDTVDKITRFWTRSLALAARAGVAEARVILDPGLGFHKTQEQNLEIIRRLSELKSLGRPLLLGASRKSMIGKVLGGTPDDRLEGTLTTTVLAVCQGVELLRVHDVRANARAVKMAETVLRR